MNHETPALAVDGVVIVNGQFYVLIERRFAPKGWALPGGFVDVDETSEQAIRREILEETGLTVTSTQFVGVYDDPNRDPRKHVVSHAFLCFAEGELKAGDDAKNAIPIPIGAVMPGICFDHQQIIHDAMALLPEDFSKRLPTNIFNKIKRDLVNDIGPAETRIHFVQKYSEDGTYIVRVQRKNYHPHDWLIHPNGVMEHYNIVDPSLLDFWNQSGVDFLERRYWKKPALKVNYKIAALVLGAMTLPPIVVTMAAIAYCIYNSIELEK